MDYFLIAREFVDQFFPDADGAMLSGSAVTGNMKTKSDLDILIFYSDIHSHYRALYNYKGQKIEAMVHRISECRQTFEIDYKRRNRSFLDLVVKGRIIKDTDEKVAALHARAAAIYQQKPPPFTPFEIDLYHYLINNRLDDFIDTEDYHESYFILSNLLYFISKVVLIQHGQWSNKTDGKWQLRCIQAFDPVLANKLTEGIDDFCKRNEKDKITQLTRTILAQLTTKESCLYKAGIPPGLNKVRKWFLIDLYYADPHEELLSNLVKAFLQEIKANHPVEKVFFTRNSSNGAHINIYVVADDKTIEEYVIPIAERMLGDYLSLNPSLRIVPPAFKRLPKKYQLFPNNSFQYHYFEVDAIKYIGSEALKIVEQEFEASSEFVLEMIEANAYVNFNEKLGEVIKINWLLLCAFGLNAEQAYLFLNAYWHSWSTYQFNVQLPPFLFNNNAVDESRQPEANRNSLQQRLEQKYVEQKDSLLPYLESMQNAMLEYSIPENEILCKYFIKLDRIKEMLAALAEQQCLFTPDPVYDTLNEIKILEEYPLWLFYKEFLHSLNNRLGIIFENEKYVIYIMTQIARQLTENARHEKMIAM